MLHVAEMAGAARRCTNWLQMEASGISHGSKGEKGKKRRRTDAKKHARGWDGSLLLLLLAGPDVPDVRAVYQLLQAQQG